MRGAPPHARSAKRGRWLIAAATALASLAAAAPAAADMVTKTAYVDDAGGQRIDLRIYDPIAFQCGTSHVEATYRDEGVLRVRYRGGEPIKVARFVKGSGTVWLIDDNTGAVLASESGSSPRTETFDLQAKTYTLSGTTKHNNVPGLGRVAQAGGTFTYELLSFDTATLANPALLSFTTGELLHASDKSILEPDWCAILAAL
jgi:hypothetical protein